MERKYKYHRKNILIIGLAETGRSIARFLIKRECKVLFFDDNQKVRGIRGAKRIDLKNIKLGVFDYIFVSPGISKKHTLVKKIYQKELKLFSDIELFLYNQNFYNKKNTLIAITGTNGKSTVAMMIAKAINSKPLGNYGNLVLDNIESVKKNIVLEISSFQLDYIEKMKTNISIITNIRPDHISHHGSFKKYMEAKLKIANNQSKQGFLILNYDDINLRNIFTEKKFSNSKIIWISRKKSLETGIFIKNDYLVDNYFDFSRKKIEAKPFLKLDHNKLNLAISYACLKAIKKKTSYILEKLQNFNGLPHRIEYIGRINDINFFNDSKATNVAATCSALECFQKVILIAGGSRKGDDFQPLKKYSKKIYAVFLYGDTASEIGKILEKISRTYFCKDLVEAVNTSYLVSNKSELKCPILLSPASASYGLYKNYEKRGLHFKKIFRELKKSAA